MAEINLDYTAFSFDQIKDALKQVLKNDGVITDQNFEGSNTATLLNILAYTTALMNGNISFMANEQFIQTASLRKNIMKHAKALKYRVNRRISAKADIQFTFTLNDGQSLYIPEFTAITPSEGDGTTFLTLEPISATNNSGSTQTYYRYSTIKEGTLITYEKEPALRFTYNNEDFYTIPIVNIEDSGIYIHSTKPNGDVVNFKEYKPGEIYTDGNVFLAFSDFDTGYVQIGKDVSLKYNIDLSLNDVITMSIIQSKGASGNGYTKFGALNISNINVDVVIDPASPYSGSYGGYEEESIESIKKYAPLYHSSGERAVSKDDWSSVISRHALAEAAVAWGGEEFSEDINTQDLQYVDFEIALMKKLGNVYFSCYPSTNYDPANPESNYLTNEDIATILNYAKSYTILGLKRNYVQPVYFYFDIFADVYVKADPKYSISNVDYEINQATQNYLDTVNSALYGRTFKYPELVNILYEVPGVSSVDIKWDTDTPQNTTGTKVYSKLSFDFNKSIFHAADSWKDFVFLNLPVQLNNKAIDIPKGTTATDWGKLAINAPTGSTYSIYFEAYTSNTVSTDPRNYPQYFNNTNYIYDTYAGTIGAWKTFIKKIVYKFPSTHPTYPNGTAVIGEFNGRANQIVFYNKFKTKVYWGSSNADLYTVDLFNDSTIESDVRTIQITNKIDTSVSPNINYFDLTYLKAVKENIFLPGNTNLSITKLK